MNAVAALFLALYLGTVMVRGNGAKLWEAAKVDAPQFIPWLIAVLVLVVVYQQRDALGPAKSLVVAVILAAVISLLLLSSGSFARAIEDIGAALKGEG